MTALSPERMTEIREQLRTWALTYPIPAWGLANGNRAERVADAWANGILKATPAISALFSEVEQLRPMEAVLAAVRELHQPTTGKGWNCDEDDTPGSYGAIAEVCTTCGTAETYGVRWPCPTVAALDGAP